MMARAPLTAICTSERLQVDDSVKDLDSRVPRQLQPHKINKLPPGLTSGPLILGIAESVSQQAVIDACIMPQADTCCDSVKMGCFR